MDDSSLEIKALLDRLFGDETVPIHLLYELTDRLPDDLLVFKELWPQQPVERRRELARHLADITEESFAVDFSPLFAFLLADGDAAVRQAALDGLWDCEKVGLIDPLLELVRTDPDVAVRALAASTLGHYVLISEWGQLPEMVGDQIVAELLVVFDQERTPDPVRRAILETIGPSPNPRVPQLIQEAYDSRDHFMRLSAIFAMGGSADRRWVPLLLQEMQHMSSEVRLEAARAAGNIGSSDAIDRLAELVADEDYEVRLAAVHALGQIGSEAAAEILDQIIMDPEAEDLHEAATEAYEQIVWLAGDMDLSLLDLDIDDLPDDYPQV